MGGSFTSRGIPPSTADSVNGKPLYGDIYTESLTTRLRFKPYAYPDKYQALWNRSKPKELKQSLECDYPFENIAFSGGGVKGFAYMGALQVSFHVAACNCMVRLIENYVV